MMCIWNYSNEKGLKQSGVLVEGICDQKAEKRKSSTLLGQWLVIAVHEKNHPCHPKFLANLCRLLSIFAQNGFQVH